MKIHLSSQYDNLDLEKIMYSQYPALQLIPLSGLTKDLIDRSNPSKEEYITPVLGTLTVDGITESKPVIPLPESDPIIPEIPKLNNECGVADVQTNLPRSPPWNDLNGITPTQMPTPTSSLENDHEIYQQTTPNQVKRVKVFH